MAQNFFAAVTTLSLPLVDANFTTLFDVREMISTPSYTASAPRLSFDTWLTVIRTTNGAPAAWRFSAPSSTGAAQVWDIGTNIATDNAFEVYDRQNSVLVDRYISGGSGYRSIYTNGTERLRVDSAATKPIADGTYTLGAASNRWSTVYASTGSINTSDAREKTAVQPLTAAEIAAAKQLAAELGSFRFLAAVAAKGPAARLHIGMTVQRAMEIMVGHGLDPMAYGFICHDAWSAETVPARTERRETGLSDAQGQPLTELVELEPARTIPAGDRYGFRVDELLLFLARGFDARLRALEAAA